MCSHVPTADTQSEQYTVEIPGANRLHGEGKVVADAGALILWHEPEYMKASLENMREAIKQHNPAILHIAGYNQNRGTDRLVGFSDGDDGLVEVTPDELADIVVNAAVLAGAFNDADCALSCVIINASNGLQFAAALLRSAKENELHNLRVICWPHLTDDIVCQQFVHGFYECFGAVGQSRPDWLEMCFKSGRLNVAGRKVQFTPELMRGGPAEITVFEPRQLLDVGSVEAALAGAEAKKEQAGSGRWLVEASSVVDKEFFDRLTTGGHRGVQPRLGGAGDAGATGGGHPQRRQRPHRGAACGNGLTWGRKIRQYSNRGPKYRPQAVLTRPVAALVLYKGCWTHPL
jgi:hypothetical protein